MCASLSINEIFWINKNFFLRHVLLTLDNIPVKNYIIISGFNMEMSRKLRSRFKYFNGFAFRELKILLVVLFIIGGTWVFIEIADEVTEGSTQNFDQYILNSLRESENHSQPVGPVWLRPFFSDITALGGGVVLTFLMLLIGIYFFLVKNYRSLILVLIAGTGGGIIDTLLKEYFMRPRPDIIIRLTEASSYSFPSGHSMMSAVIYLSLAAILARNMAQIKLRVYIISVALFLTFIIGVSRIYLGVHYPTDVLAGWSAGLAWASLCWIVSWYFEQKATKKLKKKSSDSMMD